MIALDEQLRDVLREKPHRVLEVADLAVLSLDQATELRGSPLDADLEAIEAILRAARTGILNSSVRGMLVKTILREIGDVALRIAVRQGIDPRFPQADWDEEWLPLLPVLATLEEISLKLSRESLRQSACHTAATLLVKQPDPKQSLESSVIQLDRCLQSFHRNVSRPGFYFRPSGERSAHILSSTPYPCDFDRGILDAFVLAWQSQSVFLDLRHERVDRHCKDLARPHCLFTLFW